MPNFNRKHYRIIAAILNRADNLDDVINMFIDEFKQDNHLFDRLLFVEACKKNDLK